MTFARTAIVAGVAAFALLAVVSLYGISTQTASFFEGKSAEALASAAVRKYAAGEPLSLVNSQFNPNGNAYDVGYGADGLITHTVFVQRLADKTLKVMGVVHVDSSGERVVLFSDGH